MNALQELKEQTQIARGLLQTFASILADDDQALADLIEGQTDLDKTLTRAVLRIQELEAMDTANAIIAEQISARRSRLKAQADSLRTAITIALEATNTKKLELPFATVSRRAVPAKAQVINEAEIPSPFWKRADPKVDMRSLLAALKEGPVPGAELSNGSETISIKWS